MNARKNLIWKVFITIICLIFLTSIFATSKKAIPSNPLTDKMTEGTPFIYAGAEGEKQQQAKEPEKAEGKTEKQPQDDEKTSTKANEAAEKKASNNQYNEKGQQQTAANNAAITAQTTEQNPLGKLLKNNEKQLQKIHKEKLQKTPSSLEQQEQEENDEEELQIVAGEKDENPYFITSINDGETVSTATYHFSITQKNPKVKVLQQVITLNDEALEQFDGAVQLQENDNTIDIKIQYDDEKQTIVHKTYTIYYVQNKLIVTTSLKNSTVTTEKLQFTATAKFNNDEVKITAFLEDEPLVKNKDGQYEVKLREGQNQFHLAATFDGEKASKNIIVNYERKQSTIQFETDLKNGKTTNAEITFYATAAVEDEAIAMTATLNEEMLKETNHYYSNLLNEGKNIITLYAKNDEDEATETYTIYYAAPENEENSSVVKDDVAGPTIKTDLVNNSQVSGTKKNMIVWATSADNKRIQASGVTVHNNGKAVPVIWDDSEKTSYAITLEQGKNTVIIKAWDEKGRISSKTYTIYAKNIEAGNIIGHATISMDLTVLGLGMYIPPTIVELREGVNGAYIIDEFLKKQGFTYANTGTLDANFYLARVYKKGLLKNINIPKNIEEKLQDGTFTYIPTNYSEDELGEFDISSGSGWMYSINNDYSNYSLSQSYFLNGDKIILKYTLLLGAD